MNDNHDGFRLPWAGEAYGLRSASGVKVRAARHIVSGSRSYYGFEIQSSDQVWSQCVHALEEGEIHSDLGGLDEMSAPVRQGVTD